MDQLYHDLRITPHRFVSQNPFKDRQGFLLSWYDNQGKKAFSDVCPLPGYSFETLDMIKNQLDDLDKGLVSDDVLYPSVHFALHHPLFEDDQIKPQRYQALVQKQTLSSDLLRLESFKTIKLKTKGLCVEDLKSLVTDLGKSFVVRLDAQREKLDPKVIDFLMNHDELYEYIEEPYLDQNSINLKIALDETLYLEKTIPDLPRLCAFVYKPTLVGGLNRLKKMDSGYKIVLSSCYETTLGIKRIIKLHQMLHEKDPFDIGLDTFPESDNLNYLKINPPYLS